MQLCIQNLMLSDKVKDKTLYQRLKQKDKEAFIKAYDLYLSNIYRFVYFKVDSHEEAEDITSQTFLKTWDYIQNNQIDEYKNLKSLLYKVARNTVIDHYRKKSQQQNISLSSGPDETTLDLADAKQDLIKKAETDIDFAILQKVMFQLKDEYREIITLRYVNELTISEIAEVLDKNKGSVRVQIFRALNALRDLINEQR